MDKKLQIDEREDKKNSLRIYGCGNDLEIYAGVRTANGKRIADWKIINKNKIHGNAVQ